MKLKKLLCLLLTVILIALCSAGCWDEQEIVEEEPAQEEFSDLEASDQPLEIEEPEDGEAEEDGAGFGG